MQTSGGRDHDLWSNEHLSGIDSTGTYPAVNHVDALPHVVSVRFISLHAAFADGGCVKGPWTRESKSTST